MAYLGAHAHFGLEVLRIHFAVELQVSQAPYLALDLAVDPAGRPRDSAARAHELPSQGRALPLEEAAVSGAVFRAFD